MIEPFIPNVIASLSEYRVNLSLGRISKIVLNDEQHSAYYDLYDSKSEGVLSIKDNVWKLYSTTTLCSYCQIDTVKDLDHYFPRSVFPEFSISSQNLVPSCSVCNSDYKKVAWANTPNRKYLHPYFDTIPECQFLYCSTVISDRGIYTVSFDVKSSINVQGQVFDLLKNHFDELGLRSRYVAKVTSEEVPKIERILSSYNAVPDKIINFQNFVDQQIQANAVNTWVHAFYCSISMQVDRICRL